MFSKKVEEFDDLKQTLALKDKTIHSLQLEKADLSDYKAKYAREAKHREELYQQYGALNDQLEAVANDNRERLGTILQEKEELIQENRELNKQLSEAEDEIALLKQQVEEVRTTAQRTEGDLEVERRRVQALQNVKE